MTLTDEANESLKRRRRPRKVVLLVALTVTLSLLCCVGGAAAFFLDGLSGDDEAVSTFGCGASGPLPADGDLPKISDYSPTQIRNAATIINVGSQLKVPPKGWVIAVATAMQESSLNNLGNLGNRNDHDSLGLFQQRPSQGWGTPEQIMDPQDSSRKFYKRLLTVPDCDKLPLPEAAQRFQRRPYPDAYAQHEPTAALAVNVL